MPTKLKLLSCILGLTIGNFGYQALIAHEPNYQQAAERTFFQVVAVLAYAIP